MQHAGEHTLALEVISVSKSFPGVLANDEVTLDVRHGEILGLLGENGAGKSTLMNIVYGLYKPDGGEIRVHGEAVSIRSPQHALELGIGMVHQHFMLVPDMTVAENVSLAASRLPGRTQLGTVQREVEELSTQFGLDIDAGAVIEDLSVGARQRVEIIKLLYRGADILILDEPTAALTPHEWHDLAHLLRRMADDGKAVIFITHKLDELFGLVDRCTVLRDGRVVGTVDTNRTDKRALATDDGRTRDHAARRAAGPRTGQAGAGGARARGRRRPWQARDRRPRPRPSRARGLRHRGRCRERAGGAR